MEDDVDEEALIIVGVIIDGVRVDEFIGAVADGNADVDKIFLVPLFVDDDDVVGLFEAISDSNRRSLSEKFKFSGGSGLSIAITFGFGFGATGGGATGRLLILLLFVIDANVVAGDEG
uniref:Uncharacterized protein n=1 Tax=Panagrolaimus superbus TaxID=310955 RepID=A0A914Y3P0_9BILA